MNLQSCDHLIAPKGLNPEIPEACDPFFLGSARIVDALTQPGVLFVGAFPDTNPLDRYVSGDLALRLKTFGWQTLTTSTQKNRLLRLPDMLMGILRNRKHYQVACVDVFSGLGFVWAEAACALLRLLRKPIVLTLHGGNLPSFSRKHPARIKRLFASARAITCPSAYLFTEMKEYRTGLILLPNGIDLSLYTFRPPQPPLRNLVWLRAFHQIYNPDMAVRVLHELRNQHPDSLLTMIGPDKGDGSLERSKALAASLGVSHAIDFRGPVLKSDVPRELEKVDIFLNTTNLDNTPISVIEAMACGLPVVSTNVGGLPYLLTPDKTGLLIPPNDHQAMALAVKRLSSEAGLSERLSQAGRTLVESFDWRIILPRWEALLTEVSRPGQVNAREAAQCRHPETCAKN
jgi:glycosyltransferase involved in cell wall biosynthesis